ncbi:MAG: hypothetical protein GY856_13280 [bacterium]|nr:hypothetical protein [bacterium]
MTNTPIPAILAVLLASLLGAAGQYLFKTAANHSEGSVVSYYLSPWALAGMGCYLTITALFHIAFRQGGTVVVLYPIYASTFIWAALIGWLLYGLAIRPVQVLGMVLLVAGMYCMGMGPTATS